MNSNNFTVIFVIFLLLSICVQFVLASRQIRHVLRHKNKVPEQFEKTVALAAHQKAADYTVSKSKFAIFSMLFNGVILVAWTIFGGLQTLSQLIYNIVGVGIGGQLCLVGVFALISTLIELPFNYYAQFKLEERFGFNRMSIGLFIRDLGMNLLLTVVLGAPLLWVILFLMSQAGQLWWFYTWIVWSGFQLFMIYIYPNWIAPLFNKFEPLKDETLKNRIESLMARVGFASNGLYVMDGSKRSAHGNANFSGLGKNKQIVFFDTLIDKLSHDEIEAVLAHELGHFKLNHIKKRMILMSILSLGFLALLGFLKEQAWFFTGLGFNPTITSNLDAVALLLFALSLPVFTFMFTPWFSLSSRRHEFEADAFAVAQSNAQHLVNALVKLYEDNASTLTPDPLYAAIYYSHPPASIRVQEILKSTTN